MQETITLASAGPIAGIPGGDFGPGTYIIDWDARTVTLIDPPTPAVDEQEAAEPVQPSE